LKKARDSYYSTGESEFTDDEYDALKSKYAHDLSEAHDLPSAWKKVKHLKHMGSMSLQLRSQSDVLSRMPEDVMVSLKYDGLSLEVVYENGEILRAALRGNGDEGEDVLFNACHVPSIPRTVASKDLFAVYGELVISWNNLQALNEMRADDGLEPYKTPRNAVSCVRALNLSQRGRVMALMSFKAFDAHPRPSSDQVELTRWLVDSNFSAAACQAVDNADVWQKIERMDAAVSQGSLQYQCDGIVVRSKFDFDHVAKVKLPPRAAITTVIRIIDSLGRTGVVSPVVEIEPVVLGGVTVSKVTGHNFKLMEDRLFGLGIGATVLISRRGDVIPHIESVMEASSTPYAHPALCPSCESELEWSGAHLLCSADPSECSGTSLGLLVKYCRSVGIDGVGPVVADVLVKSGLAVQPADLYSLDPVILSSIPMTNGEMGEKIATRIVNSVWSHSTMTFGQLLGAVGVRGCATSVMESVALAFPDVELLESATVEELSNVDGVGSVRAQAIRDFIDSRWEVVTGLLEHVDIRRTIGPLTGMTFCITLGLSIPRTEMESKIRSAGGLVKSSVSRSVTHVVCNAPGESTSKLSKAKELGIPVVSESWVSKLIGAFESEIVEHTEDDQF
jgi:DNA ligase (NAD+)